jgi:hypothetical protein
MKEIHNRIQDTVIRVLYKLMYDIHSITKRYIINTQKEKVSVIEYVQSCNSGFLEKSQPKRCRSAAGAGHLIHYIV